MRIPGFSPRTWLMVGLAGVLLRLFLWWFTIGTNDATMGFRLAPILYSQGVLQTYHNGIEVNQPPPICVYAGQAWRWSGDDLRIFARLIKLWALAGEALALWALWRFAGPLAFAVYAWLPAPILVSGFHCNIDCLYAALLLVSAIAFDRRRYFLSGLLMAAACNVKVLPALLAPLLLIAAPNRKALLRICAALGLGVLPYVPFVLAPESAFFRNVIGYNSNPEHWGIPMLLRGVARIPALEEFVRPMLSWFRAEGRYVVWVSVLAFAVLSRVRWHLSMAEQMAVAGALFLVLAPGFGVQYVVLIAPLLCLIDLQAAILWGWTSGAFIASVYWVFMFQWWPARAQFTSAFPTPTWIVGLAAFGVLLLFLWRHFHAAWTPGRPTPVDVPPPSFRTAKA